MKPKNPRRKDSALAIVKALAKLPESMCGYKTHRHGGQSLTSGLLVQEPLSKVHQRARRLLRGSK